MLSSSDPKGQYLLSLMQLYSHEVLLHEVKRPPLITYFQSLVLVWELASAVFHLGRDALGSISTPSPLGLLPTWMVDSGEEKLVHGCMLHVSKLLLF